MAAGPIFVRLRNMTAGSSVAVVVVCKSVDVLLALTCSCITFASTNLEERSSLLWHFRLCGECCTVLDGSMPTSVRQQVGPASGASVQATPIDRAAQRSSELRAVEDSSDAVSHALNGHSTRQGLLSPS